MTDQPGTVRFAEHTIIGSDGWPYIIDLAKEITPGLLVYRIPDGMHPTSPHRWRIGHHSGLSVADAMRREDAIKGAELLGTLADWTQGAAEVKASINPAEVFARLSYVNCIPPASEPMRGNVSHNGTYTEADLRETAAEFNADGYNALDILVAMSARVPWMGLDTEAFNEAHDRIVQLADDGDTEGGAR